MSRTPMYFIDGELIAEDGDVRAYKFEGDIYLEAGRGHFLWTHSREIKAYEDQISGLPKGDCLEIGLGLGMCSTFILGHDVASLVTLEINPHIINVYRKLNPIIDSRHAIIYGNGLDYIIKTDRMFDFIYLDFYSLIDEDTLPEIKFYVSAAKRILKPGGVISGWFDTSTPTEFVDMFWDIFKGMWERRLE